MWSSQQGYLKIVYEYHFYLIKHVKRFYYRHLHSSRQASANGCPAEQSSTSQMTKAQGAINFQYGKNRGPGG